MKVKKYEELNEELTPDQELQLFVTYLTKKFNKKINVQIQGNIGNIFIDGDLIFTTRGPSSYSVVSAYISGMVKAANL